MTDRVVIEGGVIRHEQIVTVSQAPLESISQHLVRRIATTLPALPAHPTRYVHFDGADTNRGLFLVESPPGVRNIRVDHEDHGRYPDDAERRTEGTVGIWRVQFPWQYFAFPFRVNVAIGGAMNNFVLDDARYYWARDQFRGTGTRLLPAPAPNIDTDGRICWGGTRATNTSLDARIDDYINSFFVTTFNDHLGHRTPFGESLNEWEENSPENNPLAWHNWPIWEDQAARMITADQIPWDRPAGTIDAAALDPAFIEPPTIPANFTLARAREYLMTLTEPARQRLLAAGQAIATETPPAPTEDIVIDAILATEAAEAQVAE